MFQREPHPEPLPTISVDPHFANVPRLQNVEVDSVLCADLLAARGIARHKIHKVHVYVRPDYQLAYTKEERAAMKTTDPDYDDIAGSCEPTDDGGALITIVYGTRYKTHALLLHEADHAKRMLDDKPAAIISALSAGTVMAVSIGLRFLGKDIQNPALEAIGFAGSYVAAFGTYAYIFSRRSSLLFQTKNSDAAEEVAADQAMNNPELLQKYKNAIVVERAKRRKKKRR